MNQKQSPGDKKSLKSKADKVAKAIAGAQAPVAGAPEVKKKKLQPECIRIDMFGDLLKFSKKSPEIQSPFRKYDALALSLAEEPREERLLLYHFFCGVALTAHARRTKDAAKRRQIFDTKNRLFLGLANNFNVRKLLNFRLCVSRRFKVLKYCAECAAKNAEAKLDPREWKFCPKCTTDRNYYNVLSMFHKYTLGGASLFLGNDMVHHIKGLKILKRVKFGQLKEELTFKRYTFSPKNLVSIDLNTLLVVSQKILELDAKQQGQVAPGGYQPQAPGSSSPTRAAHNASSERPFVRSPGSSSPARTSGYVPPAFLKKT